MSFSEFSVWTFIMAIAVLLFSMLLSSALKQFIPFLRKSLIPVSVLGGIILLIVSTITYYAAGEYLFNLTVFGGNGSGDSYSGMEVLEMITLDRDTAHYKKLVAEKYGELVYNGLWFSPLREALDAFVNKTQETVTGDVKLKLYKGNVMNAGITSPYTLYDETVASFGDDGGAYNQKDAAGFINLFGLPLKVKALLDQKREANED